MILRNGILDDMQGDDNFRKNEIYPLVYSDQNINADAKNWLKRVVLEFDQIDFEIDAYTLIFVSIYKIRLKN